MLKGIARDWDLISTAFDDLASLAEACEDDRLENYPDIEGAFQRVHRVVTEAEAVVGNDEHGFEVDTDPDGEHGFIEP